KPTATTKPSASATTSVASSPSAKSSTSASVASAASSAAAAPDGDPFAPGPVAANALDPNAWVKQVARRPVLAKVGDKVWAATLDTNGVAGVATRLTIQEVAAIGPKGDTATLKDARGNTYENVSGGVIFARPDASKLKPGDMVTAQNGANLLVAKLVK